MARSLPEPSRRARVRIAAAGAALACACVVAAHARAQVDPPASPAATPPPVVAGLPPGNSEMPITLEAASSDFDYKNNALAFRRIRITQGGLEVTAQQASATGLEFENSEWRLQGDVRISVPGGKLASSEARVQFRNNAIARATIKGTPAEFEQRLRDEDQVARGRAASIEYDVQAGTVHLTGDAWLSDGRNEIRGHTLVYDIGRERVQANPDEKDPGGVRITINPPKKTGAAPDEGGGT